MAAQKEGDVVTLHCNGCHGNTRHTLVKRIRFTGEDEEQGFHWSTTYDVFQCRGCEGVVLRKIFWFSEDPDADEKFFPPPVTRWLPKWQYKVPNEIRLLLQEVYNAMHSDSRSIAMMGARAIIETAMVSKVGDKGSFASHLKAMESVGLLSKSAVTFLEVALDAGSASMHRAHRPSSQDLHTVMDIVENFLQSLFVLERAAKDLKASTPQRPAKKGALAKPPKTTSPPAKP
jgi:hypothetical protein